MSRFQTTRWTMVLDARCPSGDGARALGELCRVYRPPVHAFVRGRGYSAVDADDLTQGFFEHLLRLRIDARADPERGRFRVWLLVSLKNYLATHEKLGRAIKRGGGASMRSLDGDGAMAVADPAPDASPDLVFERDFARATVSEALARLRVEAELADKAALFAALKPFLLESPERDEYAGLSARLGLRRNTIAVAIHRLRQRLQELVRHQLVDTLEGPDQLDGELQRLQATLAQASDRAVVDTGVGVPAKMTACRSMPDAERSGDP